MDRIYPKPRSPSSPLPHCLMGLNTTLEGIVGQIWKIVDGRKFMDIMNKFCYIQFPMWKGVTTNRGRPMVKIRPSYKLRIIFTEDPPSEIICKAESCVFLWRSC